MADPVSKRTTLANVAQALSAAESSLYAAYVILDVLKEEKLARQIGTMQHKLAHAAKAFQEGDLEAALDALMAWGYHDE